MKNSNLFSDYMVAQSVNRSIRSINHSPTSGVIHKQRSSYGPRLTLMNRSKIDSPRKQQQNAIQNHQYIQKILLLSLQITRLNCLNEGMRKQTSQEMNSSKTNIFGSKELTLIKQANQTLKITIKNMQSSLMKSEQQKSKTKMSYQTRLNQMQLKEKNYEWKINEYEKQLQKIRKQKSQMQINVEKLLIEKSKLQMKESKYTSLELQKNIQTQKNHEIALLQDKISRLEFNLRQQKDNMLNLKMENQLLSRRQTELELLNQDYVKEFEQIKKRINYELKETAMNTQTEINHMNFYDSLKQENQMMYKELQEIEIQMKDKENIISELKQNNFDFRNKFQNLMNLNNERQFYEHKRYVQLEERIKFQGKQKEFQIQNLKQEIQKLILEIDLLKKIISEQKETIELKNIEIANKNYEMNDKLRKTERKLRNAQRLSLSKKQIQNIYMMNTNQSPNAKLLKSRSIESTSFFSSRKGMDYSLQSIVTTTVALQSSNQRSLRLIKKSQERLATSQSLYKNKRKVFVTVNNNQKHEQNNNKNYIQNSNSQSRQTQKRSRDIPQHQRHNMQNKHLKSSGYKNKNNTLMQKNLASSIHEYYGNLNDDIINA